MKCNYILTSNISLCQNDIFVVENVLKNVSSYFYHFTTSNAIKCLNSSSHEVKGQNTKAH